MKSGDIIKLKVRGRKEKFRVLCPTDIITDDCLQQYITDEIPLCYDTVVGMANVNGRWTSTTCSGEMVCDDHCGRVYIKPIDFFIGV